MILAILQSKHNINTRLTLIKLKGPISRTVKFESLSRAIRDILKGTRCSARSEACCDCGTPFLMTSTPLIPSHLHGALHVPCRILLGKPLDILILNFGWDGSLMKMDIQCGPCLDVAWLRNLSYPALALPVLWSVDALPRHWKGDDCEFDVFWSYQGPMVQFFP